MKHFISYPFWINEVACWSDLKSLNGPVGTENRGVAVFTHRDTTQLIESTFAGKTFGLRPNTKAVTESTNIHTEGSCLMLLLGPGKKSH